MTFGYFKVGDIIEIPNAPLMLNGVQMGYGPMHSVDPLTRKAKAELQRFRVISIEEGNIKLEPVNQ